MSRSSSGTDQARAQTRGEYWSVDSAPEKLTRPVSHWAAPMVLAIFTLVSVSLILLINHVPVISDIFPHHDLILAPYEGKHSIPLRIFIISFYIAFVAVSGASFWGRARFFIQLSFYFIVLCLLCDGMATATYSITGYRYSLHAAEIFSGILGYMVFSLALLDRGNMPPRAPVPFSMRLKLGSTLRVAGAMIAAMVIARYVDSLQITMVNALRDLSLLGGIGPGVFLFLPVLTLLLYIIGLVQYIRRPKAPFAPPLTLIIPAHNEAHVIGRTLAAVDASAEFYRGVVTVLVLDNGSRDNTAAAARAAFAELPFLRGEVIEVPTPGKARALNHGLGLVKGEFMVRIDADTQILPETLSRAMRHFSRLEVGIVGGMPLAPGDGPFDRARTIEVLLKHGLYQLGYGAMDAIIGVPGMFAAYRTELVRAAGGFVIGMNGEDTDVSLRIGEMGYRVIGDPSVQYVSEVPRTYHHMREQRMRWFRSVYHVSARNRSYLQGWRPSLRGKLILPFMLLNSARRAMTVPLAIYGLAYYILRPEEGGTITLTAVVAVLLGAPALMGAFAALANGRPRALLGLPEYVGFRLLRSYFTLESVLSIAFDKSGRRAR
jgi:glycosyltransferase involved in cell wall biosynthesis